MKLLNNYGKHLAKKDKWEEDWRHGKGPAKMHPLSPLLKDRISSAIVAALKSGDPINVIEIAERVQNENAGENVALEDIQIAVLDRAQATEKPIIFETADCDRLKPAFDNAGAEARGTFQ